MDVTHTHPYILQLLLLGWSNRNPSSHGSDWILVTPRLITVWSINPLSVVTICYTLDRPRYLIVTYIFFHIWLSRCQLKIKYCMWKVIQSPSTVKYSRPVIYIISPDKWQTWFSGLYGRTRRYVKGGWGSLWEMIEECLTCILVLPDV